MKEVLLECTPPGSSALKQFVSKKNNIPDYKCYKDVDLEKPYEIGSNILK